MNKKVQYMGILLILSLFACMNNNEKVTVNFADTLKLNQNLKTAPEKPIYIAIASITSPEETLSNYNALLNFISKKINEPIVLKQRKTYKEINELLRKGEVDLAFICSGPYIVGKKNSSLKLLVVPQYSGKTYYQSYIICNKNSGINNFSELEGKTFAYTDPLSTTGYLYPQKLLSDLHTNNQLFFDQYIFTFAHDISIQMINRGIIDGASVHSLIFNHFVRSHPEKIKNVKIIEKSEWFGTPPVVVPVNMEKSKFTTLQNIFLNLQNDSIGRKILKDLGIEKFVKVKDTLYDGVRKLKKYSSNENY